MDYSQFTALGLDVDEVLSRAFASDGISNPTAVQVQAIPAILAGQHVIIQSGTGTGKTLAYLLPVLQRLRLAGAGRVVVFAPATELAMQTLRIADRYKQPSVTTGALVATGNVRKQKARVQQSTQLVVGTASRILEQFAQRKMKGVTTMVLDEPDPILAAPDSDYLREVLSRPEPKVQLIFAAATLGAHAKRLAREVMGESAVHTQVEDNPLQGQIAHHFVQVQNENSKDVQLARFLEQRKSERAIVFVNQPHLLRHLFRFLSDKNLKPATLSRDRSKLEIQRALAAFTRAEARVLLSTDNAMTGMDIRDVPWILHYELPASALAYVHRAGRTGRAGKQGRSVAFVTREERVALGLFERELGIHFAPVGEFAKPRT
jgi:superfamily II DNA/RNA helicase